MATKKAKKKSMAFDDTRKRIAAVKFADDDSKFYASLFQTDEGYKFEFGGIGYRNFHVDCVNKLYEEDIITLHRLLDDFIAMKKKQDKWFGK